jgi:hypothetical protein
MTRSRFSSSIVAVGALSLVVWSAAPAFAQHRGGGSRGGNHGGGSHSGGSRGGGGGSAMARSAPSGQRAAHSMQVSGSRSMQVSGSRSTQMTGRSTQVYGARTAPMSSAAGHGPANAPYGSRYAAPRGAVAYGGSHYGGAYYSSGRYYGGARYYGGYGYRYAAPIHYVTPYYHFRPWYSVGFGISIGYPVPWSYPYYYPVYYPAAYVSPYAYPAPYAATSSPTYSTNDGMYPESGSAYPSQGPAGTTGSAYPSQYETGATGMTGSATMQHTPSQQNSGGVSFEITPSNAEVFVDGSSIGTVGQFTPQSQPLGLSVGRHRLEIRAPGYQPLNVDADIVSGQVIPYQGTMQRQ